MLLEQIAREAARILERPAPKEGRPAPGLEMAAAAAATCLAFRRDEVADDEDLLRLARGRSTTSPPPGVAAWLADAGVSV